MSDPLLLSTADGFEIEHENGVMTMTDGIESAIRLSLEGGNLDDPGQSNTAKQFWGNLTEEHPHGHLRSEFQFLADGLPLSSGNLRRLEEAAKRDLAWFLEPGPTGVQLATALELEVRSPERGVVDVSGHLTIDGKAYPFGHTVRKQ